MNISPSLIFYMLSTELNIEVVRESKGDSNISIPMIFNDSNPDKIVLQSDILYICDNMMYVDKINATKCPSIIIGPPEYRVSYKNPCAFVMENLTSEDLLYKVFSIIQTLQSWDCKMKDTFRQEVTLKKVIELSGRIFFRPLLLVNSHYNYLAYSDNFFESADYMKPDSPNDTLPLDLLNDLTLNKEFLDADKLRGVHFYPSDPASSRVIFYNFFKDKTYSARLLAYIGNGIKRNSEILEGEKELFSKIATYLERVYFQHLDTIAAKRQEDQFHLHLKELLIRNRETDVLLHSSGIENYGWLDRHEYLIVALRMFNMREFELSALYLANRLEDRFPGTAALVIESELIWIINCSLYNGSPLDDVIKATNRILGDFACKAGFSTIQEGIYRLDLLYEQAIDSFRLGEKNDPHFWCYHFESYAKEYLMEQALLKYPNEYIRHPGLNKLIHSDSTEGTEYVTSLFNYIRCCFNASRAAEETFVHRSTLLRHLTLIKEISGIDLSDSIDLADFGHLLLSLSLYRQDIDT